MLRITKLAEGDAKITLKLEGQIASAWVDELDAECRKILARHTGLCLDVRDVTHIDVRGRQLLDRLRTQHVEIANCPPLIREMLDELSRTK